MRHENRNPSLLSCRNVAILDNFRILKTPEIVSQNDNTAQTPTDITTPEIQAVYQAFFSKTDLD